MTSSIRTQQVPAAGYVFEADVAGEPGNPLVLLLHGFPQKLLPHLRKCA